LASPVQVVTTGATDPDPLGKLGALVGSTQRGVQGGSGLPFAGGWFAALGYELGRRLEPAAAWRGDRRDPAWPWAAVAWRCPWALVHDGAEGAWWIVGSDLKHAAPPLDELLHERPKPAGFAAGELVSEPGREAYQRAVARGVEYVHAGDVFQVNLAHRMVAPFGGSARGLWARMLDAAGPWYGAYLELRREGGVHAALGVSPELFLSFDPRTRGIVTRPIKGTLGARGRGAPGAGDAAAALRASPKDQAELNMIVDLMRNDLGRVSAFGSVRVREARAIERHGGESGVWHGVATVEGTLRPGLSLTDLLRAAFPPGSVTGAPKVRAMQIIEELEPAPRGLYTGAVGFVGDDGGAAFNVAIRTGVVHGQAADPARLDEVTGGRLTYGVGAGIVADSVPEREWEETIVKAGVLHRALRGSRHDAPSAQVRARAGSTIHHATP
jgi:anthranilate/para-aminobenzoate synthase component I